MRPGLFIWGVSRNWRDRDVTKTSTCINPALPLGCKPIECVLRIMVQLDVASEDAVGGEWRWAATAFQVRLCRCRCRRGRHRSAFRTTVIGEELRAEIRAASFRIGPADHEGKSKTQQFCGFHEPGELPSGLDNGLILDSLSRAPSAPATCIKQLLAAIRGKSPWHPVA